MIQYIAQVTLVVKDYDEAIDFYTQQLGFKLIENTPLSNIKRWVRVAPPGSNGCCLLLAKASDDEQHGRIGNQTGGRVFMFLYTDDAWRDYRNMTENKVHFTRKPQVESYGIVAVFEDLYGNIWDLIQPNNSSPIK